MKKETTKTEWELNPKYAKEVEVTQKIIPLKGKPSLKQITVAQ